MLWRIRAARLNMQITKCFIGNGLELRVPTLPICYSMQIWAPAQHPFIRGHICSAVTADADAFE